MSLFKCSTPERRGVDQVLPVIANEIYLRIFELIAPSNECLPPEEIGTFHELSRVCRFFANVCLPRVFESVEISGSISRKDAPTYKASLGSMLCMQIAEKQPLALALAQAVRACHFTNSQPPQPLLPRGVDSRAVDPLTLKRYTSAMTLMKNIRQLQVSNWIVGAELWKAIAALPSLEDLSLRNCDFLDYHVDVGPEKRPKVSRLSVIGCSGDMYPLGDADMECLRMLTMDFWCLEHMWLTESEDWLPESTVTELHIHITEEEVYEDPDYMQGVDRVVVQMPQGLEVLCFSVGDVSVDCEDLPSVWASILSNPAWETISSLHSLTVRVADGTLGQERNDVLSLSINDNLPEVRRFLHDKLAPGSGHTGNLRYVGFFGRVFRLVDGEWLEGAL